MCKCQFYASYQSPFFRAWELLKKNGGTGPDSTILAFQNILLFALLTSMVLSAFYSSLAMAVVTGFILGLVDK